MAVVNINCTTAGVIIRPELVTINRVDQKITWQLQGGTWQEQGIVMDENPPAPYKPWPGAPAQLSGNNYVADAGDPLPPGASAEQYRYTINIFDEAGRPIVIRGDRRPARKALVPDAAVDDPTPLSIDPGVENQPQP